MSRILITCVGNRLVADDAAGCAVYDRLAEDVHSEDVRLELLELGGMRLLDILGGEELLIVVDAVQFGAAVGTIHVIRWQDLPESNGLPVTSHDIGFREAIGIGYALFPERMPKKILLIGIEGRCFDQLGAGLSPEVEVAVRNAADQVNETINQHDRKAGEQISGSMCHMKKGIEIGGCYDKPDPPCRTEQGN